MRVLRRPFPLRQAGLASVVAFVFVGTAVGASARAPTDSVRQAQAAKTCAMTLAQGPSPTATTRGAVPPVCDGTWWLCVSTGRWM
jgi:hypothetical protein